MADSCGLVAWAGNGLCRVIADADGRVVVCTIRGRLLREFEGAAGPVAPGDRVVFTPLPEGKGVIEDLLPRRNAFGRRAAGTRPGEQVIAANVDRIVVVFALCDPAFKARALDRYLAVAEYCGIPVLICLNKADLVPGDELSRAAAPYLRIGYEVVFTSARTGQGLDRLAAALADRISAVVGPSGVGKSSLLNAVEPGLCLATGEISSSTHKGRHTTTASRLIPLTAGGYVLDTAGMREFGFWEIPLDSLDACFREMRPFIGKCRFSDCAHVSEPGCAVREAVELGAVPRPRYEHYVRLRQGA